MQRRASAQAARHRERAGPRSAPGTPRGSAPPRPPRDATRRARRRREQAQAEAGRKGEGAEAEAAAQGVAQNRCAPGSDAARAASPKSGRPGSQEASPGEG
eukprot:6182293-Lingulodinium_polyedra.AAC.1